MRRLVTFSFLLLMPAAAAAQWPPERFENLRVLPDTIEQRELIDLMAGFTRALGVRCTYCHAGEEGRPLGTYDFPSDDKVTKRKAREMLRMVRAINRQYLAGLEERQDPPVAVRCTTCHGGITAPRDIEDVLLLAYGVGGLDSTVAAYRALRERYYGRAAYDFGSVPLTMVARGIRERGSLADATAVLALNVEMNPTSVFSMLQHGAAAVELAFREGGPDRGAERYRELRAEYGDTAFPEFMLNQLGYSLLGTGDLAEAVRVFEINAEAHPGSWNVYDSLAEGLAAAGDTAGAIANYRKSLEINPDNRGAADKIRELGGR